MKHFKIFAISMALILALSACGKDSSDVDINIEHQTSTQETETSTEEQTEEMTKGDYGIEFEPVSYNAVATKNVRIRTTPELLKDNVYRQLDAGKGVKVVGYSEEWCKVVYDDMIMYIATEYLVEGEPVEETTVESTEESTEEATVESTEESTEEATGESTEETMEEITIEESITEESITETETVTE